MPVELFRFLTRRKILMAQRASSLLMMDTVGHWPVFVLWPPSSSGPTCSLGILSLAISNKCNRQLKWLKFYF